MRDVWALIQPRVLTIGFGRENMCWRTRARGHGSRNNSYQPTLNSFYGKCFTVQFRWEQFWSPHHDEIALNVDGSGMEGPILFWVLWRNPVHWYPLCGDYGVVEGTSALCIYPRVRCYSDSSLTVGLVKSTLCIYH